jgi:hypothetical protein
MDEMNQTQKEKFMTQKIEEILSVCETGREFTETLFVLSCAVGGLVCMTPKENRDNLMIMLVESMSNGYMQAAERMGEPTEIQVLKGEVDGTTH